MKPLEFPLVLLLALTACGDPPSSGGPSATPSPSAPRSSSASASAPAPSATAAPTPKPSASAAPAVDEPADTWLVVISGAGELGVIELRPGKAPRLTLTAKNDDATALEKRVAELAAKPGLPLDMHMPSKDGGRGAYGTRIVKTDDRLYRHALTEALQPTFSVKPVKRLTDPLPPATIKKLEVSRDGEKAGVVDLRAKQLAVTKLSTKSDADSLERHIETIAKLDTVRVRYQATQASGEALVTVEAKPGDADYARAVVLYLMVENYYLARHAYALTFVE